MTRLTTGKSIVAQAPFATDGSLPRLPDTTHEWRPIVPFRKTPTLRTDSQRPAADHVMRQDPQGRHYPIPAAALIDMLLHSTVSRGVTAGWWTVTKAARVTAFAASALATYRTVKKRTRVVSAADPHLPVTTTLC